MSVVILRCVELLERVAEKYNLTGFTWDRDDYVK
jgi:hypothetical protein